MPHPNSDPLLRDPLIGTRIDGRYTIHGILGRGGMGVVYDGLHDELARSVAVKVLNAAWASDPTAVARFLREARTAGSMSHGNIVDVSDLGRLPDGRPYLVMPKVKGTDLASMLRQGGPQPPKRVAELLVGVAAALDLIHAKGLVHRDIKPENLMYVVREDGSETVMLLDFGIAALVASNEPRLTRQGAIFGTPEYLPPEVWDGKLPDHRGDVYALATVAFELMTGELPFYADNVMQILPLKLKTDAPSMASVSAMSFAVEVEAVVARGLAREPSGRFDSASELADALKEATARAPISWRPGVLSTQLQTSKKDTILERGPGDLELPLPAGVGAMAQARSDEREEVLSPATDSAVLAITARQGASQRASSDADTLVESAPPAERTGSSIRPPISPARRWLAYFGAGAAVLLLAVWALSPNPSEPDHLVRPAGQPTPPPRPPPTPEPERAVPAEPERHEALPQVTAPSEPSPPPVTRTPPPMARPTALRKPSPPLPAVQMKPTAMAPLATVTPHTEIPAPAPAEPSAPAPPQRDPAQAAQLTREGTSALLAGQVAHATDLLRRATRADPSQAAAWRGLGLALEQTGHPREAIDAYQKYLSLEPHSTQADKVRERIGALKK